MTTEKKKPVQKYQLPSQRILKMVQETKEAGNPMGPIDLNIMIELAILDKIEEVVLTLRSFRPVAPAPKPVEKKDEKKHTS